jgi:hypothetical protein
VKDASVNDFIEIAPKSDQLNADDLIAGPLTVKVEQVVPGKSAEQPRKVVISGHRPYYPCLSMRRLLVAVWGDKGAMWAGHSMTLFCDQSVTWAGTAIGGIRISHVTGITEPQSFLLSTAKGKRKPYTVHPLLIEPSLYPQDSFEENKEAWVSAIVADKISIPQLLHKIAGSGLVLSDDQRKKIESMVAERAPEQNQEKPQ